MTPIVHSNFEIQGRRFAKYFRTEHGDAVAHTAVHTIFDGHSIGGSRFVLEGALAELGHLSAAMTYKCRRARIDAGGQKSLIVCEGDRLPSPGRRADILTDHAVFVVERYPGAIFGPDMNAGEDVMDCVASRPGLLRHVTGLSERRGGLAIDRNGYTAIGIETAARWWWELAGPDEVSVAIQGFGAVGAHTACLLDESGMAVVAVSNQLGCIVARDGGPIAVQPLFRAWKEGGDAEVIAVASRHRDTLVIDDPNALFEVPCSLLAVSYTHLTLPTIYSV